MAYSAAFYIQIGVIIYVMVIGVIFAYDRYLNNAKGELASKEEDLQKMGFWTYVLVTAQVTITVVIGMVLFEQLFDDQEEKVPQKVRKTRKKVTRKKATSTKKKR